MSLCLCQSKKESAECCAPYLSGKAAAPTPEALMRSRYTAFAKKDIDYVVKTTDPQGMHHMDRNATREWMDNAEFTNLEILKTSEEGTKGMVEFKAHFKMNGQNEVHHEISKFRKQAGVWYFRDGKVVPPPEPKN